MNTKICPDCCEVIQAAAYRCPHCREGFPEYGPFRRRKLYSASQAYGLVLAWVCGAVGVLAVIGWLAL